MRRILTRQTRAAVFSTVFATAVSGGAGPSNFTATADAQNPSKINLSWDAVSGALWYEIETSSNGISWDAITTNGYVPALDIDDSAVAAPSTSFWIFAPNETAYFRIRAFKNDYTYTGYSTDNATTNDLTGSEITIGGGGSDYSTVTAAMAAASADTAGIFILDGDISDNLIQMKGGSGSNAHVILMNNPGDSRHIIDVNYGGTETNYGMLIGGIGYLTVQGIGLIDGPNKVIRHGDSTTASNITLNDLYVQSASASSNNSGLIQLGSGGDSSNVLVQNCYLSGGVVGLHIDARNVSNVTCQHNFYDSNCSYGIHVKFNGDADKTILAQFEHFNTESRGVFSDGDYCKWFHCLIDPTSSGNQAIYLAENFGGDYQQGKHLTIVDSAHPQLVRIKTAVTVDSIDFANCFVAGNSSNSVVTTGSAAQGNVDFGTGTGVKTSGYAGNTSDCNDFANDDFSIGSGSSAYRSASNGMDYGALIPAVGRTGAAVA